MALKTFYFLLSTFFGYTECHGEGTEGHGEWECERNADDADILTRVIGLVFSPHRHN